MMIYAYWFSCNIPVSRVRFNLEFSRQALKNTQISHVMKIHPAGAELVNADRQT